MTGPPTAPTVDVIDETFLAVPRERVAAEFADPARWPVYWPDLRPEVAHDRGPAGLRWTVTGALTGTMEVWCEEVLDGTVLHFFLRAEPTEPVPGLRRRRAGRAESDRRHRAFKAHAFTLKRRLEGGRPAGVAPSVRER
ncbi:polyketide cyclase / dehydrase and lipid transport [Pseudonocardia sp. C8]|uniref:polyketide cyclase / dehydrase and lipid transport n=1 Tax=Pseudonocardia sp. C8 TaxID=2762759 RepID=UPI0016427CCC|nr:polyketide cyclase / dehydrase and lipid transport [Pseudonocardia sp. C8]